MTREEILAMHPGKELNLLIGTKVLGLKEGIDFGSVPEHDWKKDSDGKIDELAMENGYHNGPVCKRCGHSYCVNCDPDGDSEPCVVEVGDYSAFTGIKGIEKILDKVKNTEHVSINYINRTWVLNTSSGECIGSQNLPELICKYALMKVEGVL
jgi:hypothetical protein